MQLQCTSHAIMRLLQRKNQQTIINDRTFDTWKKTNEDSTEQIKEAQEELKRIVETSDYTIKGNYDKKKEWCDYKINLAESSVVVIEESKIITIYDISFSESYSEKLNRTMAEALLKEIIEKDLLAQAIEEKNKKQEREINQEIDELEKEIKMLKEKTSILEKEKENKRQTIEIEKKKSLILKTELEDLKRKICKPLYADH